MLSQSRSKLITLLEEKHIKGDNILFDDFRAIVLLNDKSLVQLIWDYFPGASWTYACGHLFEEMSFRGMYDMLEMFIARNKLHCAATTYVKQYLDDPAKWKATYARKS